MCARAGKVLLRRMLRSANERCGHPSSRSSLLTALVTHFLNLLSGADSGSQEFWATQLTLQVLISFGHRCGRAVFVSDSLLLLALLLLVVVVVNRTSTSERRVSKAMKER